MLPISNQAKKLTVTLRRKPQAVAIMKGSADYSAIAGQVFFCQTELGILVAADITGLPKAGTRCQSPIFAFHIHSGASCTGSMEDPFSGAMTHYNPGNCPHPYHAGDLPPLFGNNGYAFSVFLTDRFSIQEIIGKTVIIHKNPDDFTTQPSGNAGEKIACGVIQRYA